MREPFLLGGLVEGICQFQNGSTADQGLFVVVSDVDIEDVDRSVQWSPPVEQVVHDGIPASFFASEYDINNASFGPDSTFISSVKCIEPGSAGNPVVKPLRAPFDVAVAIEHIQDTVVSI